MVPSYMYIFIFYIRALGSLGFIETKLAYIFEIKSFFNFYFVSFQESKHSVFLLVYIVWYEHLWNFTPRFKINRASIYVFKVEQWKH